MTITSEALDSHLAAGLKRLYVVHGDAMLLSIEAADKIRATARAAGFIEREVIIADQHFRWAELHSAAKSLSLFASRKMIELRIPSGKPGVEGAQALQDYCANLSEDVLTLVSLPRLDRTAQNSNWFSALRQYGELVAADDVPRDSLPRWIAGRLKRQEQSADVATLGFLADRCEGNLLAAFQEIQKLGLLYPPGPLTFDQVTDAVMDVSRYDVFKLSEAMLKGNSERFARILEGLRSEGTAAALVLWAISEDIRVIGKGMQAVRQGGNIRNALREARVWGVRQDAVEHAVARLAYAQVERALHHAARLDKIIKGLRQGDVWDELQQLGLRFART
jgi:DNA polymerase-3 subunit delta